MVIEHAHAAIGDSRTDFHPLRPWCAMDPELIMTLVKKTNPAMAEVGRITLQRLLADA